MMIEVLEDFKTGNEESHLKAGELRSVSDALGKRLCEIGIAKDPSGNIQTGPKLTGPKRVQPDNVNTTVGS